MLPQSISDTVDADWAGCKDTSRSTTGYKISIDSVHFIWKSKRQNLITLSSAESEYAAIYQCGKEVSWARRFFWGICNQQPRHDSLSFAHTTEHCDSISSKVFAERNAKNHRTRHISSRFHHIREFIAEGAISIAHITSKYNPSDIFTNVLPSEWILMLLDLMNMH